MNKILSFTISEQGAKQVDFVCDLCNTTRNELLRVIIENWLDQHNIYLKMKNNEREKENRRECN